RIALAGVWPGLSAFGVRAVLSIASGHARVEDHAAIACRLPLELEAQVEVAIRFFGRQVAVLVGSAFAQDRALLHNPLLRAIVFPARQIFSIEKRNPTARRRHSRRTSDAKK